MIATKLGVAAPNNNEEDASTDNYKLYLGDEALVEDTREIDNLDKLVLKALNNQVKQEVKRETEAEEVSNISDDGSEGEKEAKENKGERVVDGYAFEDMRVAKYFEVEGQQDLALFSGVLRPFVLHRGMMTVTCGRSNATMAITNTLVSKNWKFVLIRQRRTET